MYIFVTITHSINPKQMLRNLHLCRKCSVFYRLHLPTLNTFTFMSLQLLIFVHTFYRCSKFPNFSTKVNYSSRATFLWRNVSSAHKWSYFVNKGWKVILVCPLKLGNNLKPFFENCGRGTHTRVRVPQTPHPTPTPPTVHGHPWWVNTPLKQLDVNGLAPGWPDGFGEKIAQSVAQLGFMSKLIHNFYRIQK
jgi:hypothetical protein